MNIMMKAMRGRKRIFSGTIALAATALCLSFESDTPGILKVSSFGKQPAIALDGNKNVHVVFGEGNEIFYTRAADGGNAFSMPQRVGRLEKLALGGSRGPQIVSTDDYLVIAAADHTGKITAWRARHGDDRWGEPVSILHGDSTAKEGFVALAAGNRNRVYAAWLDLRIGNNNNIFSASSADGGKTWTPNTLVYQAPEGRICPCCRPSVSADKKGNVYIMFRNELDGARDLYLSHSPDGGRTFSSARKLGTGTWLLKGCPMDGGAVSADGKGNVGTTWRRENRVYYAEPGKPELKIGEGKASVMVKTARGDFFAWQQDNQIVALTPDNPGATIIAGGNYPRLAAGDDGTVVCVWEADGMILAKKFP